MRKNYENKLSMFISVEQTCEKNSGIVSTVPALAAKHDELKNKILEIRAKEEEKLSALSGKAQSKYDARDKLINSTVSIAGPMFAYGKDSERNDLIETGNTTANKLKSLRDTELVIKAMAIHDAAENVIANLSGYGVTPAMIINQKDDTLKYDKSIGVRESGMAKKGGAVYMIDRLMKETSELLYTMDNLMELFRTTRKEFYNAYHAARVIRDLGRVRHNRKGKTEPGKIVNITKNKFKDETKFTLINRGSVPLMFCTAMNSESISGQGIIVKAGEKVRKKAFDLGNPGSTHLNVKNMSDEEWGSFEVRW